jgi:Prolyl oligopeptidase family
MTQRPDLFGAIWCGYPLLDMLRYQLFLMGRTWTTEYGSAENPRDFGYIYKYSPYQHVVAGGNYPAIMFFTGEGHPCRSNECSQNDGLDAGRKRQRSPSVTALQLERWPQRRRVAVPVARRLGGRNEFSLDGDGRQIASPSRHLHLAAIWAASKATSLLGFKRKSKLREDGR